MTDEEGKQLLREINDKLGKQDSPTKQWAKILIPLGLAILAGAVTVGQNIIKTQAAYERTKANHELILEVRDTLYEINDSIDQ